QSRKHERPSLKAVVGEGLYGPPELVTNSERFCLLFVGCNHVGAQPCATRLIDSKGHSRFVLRILIILSHQSRQQREPLLLFESCRRGGPLRPSPARHKQREVLPPL